MNLGFLTLQNSTEQFMMNAKFNARELFKVIHEYAVFVRFEVLDEKGTLLLSTDLARLSDGMHLLRPVRVERKETSNLQFCERFGLLLPNNMVHWEVDGVPFRKKKDTVAYARAINSYMCALLSELCDTDHKEQANGEAVYSRAIVAHTQDA